MQELRESGEVESDESREACEASGWPYAPKRRGGAAERVSPVDRREVVAALSTTDWRTVHDIVDAMHLLNRKAQRVLVSRELQYLRAAGRVVFRAVDRGWRLRRRDERLRIVPELADVRLTVQQLDALLLYLERSHISGEAAHDPLARHEVQALREAQAVMYAVRRPFERWHDK